MVYFYIRILENTVSCKAEYLVDILQQINKWLDLYVTFW
jgi:hypothetical protein